MIQHRLSKRQFLTSGRVIPNVDSRDLDFIETNNSLTEMGHVLGDSEGLVLMVDDCQTFRLFDMQLNQVVMTTCDWAEAYRFWFALRREQMTSTSDRALNVQQVIKHVGDHQTHPLFGRLIYSCDRVFRGVLDYGVQLNDTLLLRWGPIEPMPIAMGCFFIETISRRRHRMSKWVEPLPQEDVAQAMQYCIRHFHCQQDFDLFSLNSEHFARLASTGECTTHQAYDLQCYWQNHGHLAMPQAPEPEIIEHNLDVEIALKVLLAP